jgi:hypothetical protein
MKKKLFAVILTVAVAAMSALPTFACEVRTISDTSKSDIKLELIEAILNGDYFVSCTNENMYYIELSTKADGAVAVPEESDLVENLLGDHTIIDTLKGDN